MKKLKYIVFLLSLMLCFSGCNKKQNKNLKEENEIQNSDSIISKLYGSWIIDTVIPLNVICSDPNEYLQKEIVIKNDIVIFNNIEYQIKSIKTEILDEKQFIMETKSSVSEGITFSDLGIKDENINTVTIKIEENNNNRATSFSFIISNDLIILEKRNNYFNIKKEETHESAISKLYGNWIIDSDITPEGVITLDYSEAFLNKEITITNHSIYFDNNIYKIKNIEEEIWDDERLFKETRGTSSRGVTFSKLGITDDYITWLVIKDENKKRIFTFIITGNNIFLFKDNSYFHIKKRRNS